MLHLSLPHIKNFITLSKIFNDQKHQSKIPLYNNKQVDKVLFTRFVFQRHIQVSTNAFTGKEDKQTSYLVKIRQVEIPIYASINVYTAMKNSQF